MAACSNGHGSDAWWRTWSHFRIDRRRPADCRVTFDHPPTNAITATTIIELFELIGLIESDPDLNVVVFDSANPAFYLTHHDGVNDPAWQELLVRLSRARVISIASIRGRARGAGSEFALACDLRFASRESARFAVGTRPAARLPRLVGRGRALELMLVVDEFDATRAELYGYVNRAIAEAELDGEVDRIAARLARLDHDAIARTKACVDDRTLPAGA